MRLKLRGFWHSNRGATSVEFAFVFLPLIWMFGAIIETGLFLTAQYELQSATLAASRQIRTGTLPASTTSDGLKQIICAPIVMIRNCAGSISIDLSSVTAASGGTFGTLSSAMRNPNAVGPSTRGGTYSDVFSRGGPNDPGALIATYDWEFVVPWIGSVFSNLPSNRSARRLNGVAVFKNENYS